MSKFIDKLNRLIRNEPQPMGFRAKQPTTPKSKIQLVATLAQEQAESLAGRVARADAGIIRILNPAEGAETIQKLSQANPDIPWGGWLENGGQETIEQMTKPGYDFIVFSAAKTALTIIENTGVGKILEIEPSINEGLLRAANELPIDAVLIASEQKEEYTLTWQNLMLFQHFARLLSKPLLVFIPAKVTGAELKALWESGVTGVVLEVRSKESQDSIEKLRDVIDKLEFPATRRRERREISLLAGTGREQTKVATEVEEEEE